MISNGDVDAIVQAARSLAFASGDYTDYDFGTALSLTVIDFMLKTKQVEAAAAHYETNWRRKLHTLDDFETLFSTYPQSKLGNVDLASSLWGKKYWTRAWLLRLLVALLRAKNIDGLLDLRTWARSADFHKDFEGKVRFAYEGQVYGLGTAVFHWLTLRLGVETVKPDVHVHQFVEKAIGHKVNDADAIELVKRAAGSLKRPWTAHELDNAIWEAGVGKSATAGGA